MRCYQVATFVLVIVLAVANAKVIVVSHKNLGMAVPSSKNIEAMDNLEDALATKGRHIIHLAHSQSNLSPSDNDVISNLKWNNPSLDGLRVYDKFFNRNIPNCGGGDVNAKKCTFYTDLAFKNMKKSAPKALTDVCSKGTLKASDIDGVLTGLAAIKWADISGALNQVIKSEFGKCQHAAATMEANILTQIQVGSIFSVAAFRINKGKHIHDSWAKSLGKQPLIWTAAMNGFNLMLTGKLTEVEKYNAEKRKVLFVSCNVVDHDFVYNYNEHITFKEPTQTGYKRVSHTDDIATQMIGAIKPGREGGGFLLDLEGDYKDDDEFLDTQFNVNGGQSPQFLSFWQKK